MAANWLNIAGGAAQGYVQGDEDNRRREEFRSLQRQRDRVEKQQKEDDELAATLKKVRGAGTYADPQGYEAASDFQGPVPEDRKKSVTVTESDADRQRANIIAARGRPEDLARSAALRTQAYQSDQAARQEKQAKGFETLSQAEDMLANGNHVGAARLLQSEYAKHPDGHDIVFEQKDGVMQMGVAAGGKYVEPPVPVTPESVKGMIDRGYRMLSPEARASERKYGLDERTTKAHEVTANAAQQHAQSEADKTYYETLGRGGDNAAALSAANVRYLDAHAQYMRSRGAAENQAAKFGQSQQFTDKTTGETVYATPIRNSKTGELTWQRETMPSNLEPMKKPAELSDFQKEQVKAHFAKDAAGGYKTPIEASAALDAIIHPQGQGRGTIAQLNAAGPPPAAKNVWGIAPGGGSAFASTMAGGQAPTTVRQGAAPPSPRPYTTSDYRPSGAPVASDDPNAAVIRAGADRQGAYSQDAARAAILRLNQISSNQPQSSVWGD